MAEEGNSLSNGLETSPGETPTVKELEELGGLPVTMLMKCGLIFSWEISHNRFGLWKMGITHVLNAAHGRIFSQGSPEFYGTTIKYHSVPAYDLPDFDLSPYFYTAAEFIDKALTTPGAKILVHCAVGISRSSSLVLAYLMIYHHFSLVQAIQTVKSHRWIFPNRGFLKQLRNLDIQLRKNNSGKKASHA